MNQFGLGNVKGGMDAHGLGELQPHYHRVDVLLDGEWTDEFWTQLVGLKA